MKERENYMLCCNCGYAVKQKRMFMKAYKDVAFCLCLKCAKELREEINCFEEKAKTHEKEQKK